MAEFNFNPIEIDYIIGGVNNNLAYLCDKYLDKLEEIEEDSKILKEIAELYEVMQILEDNHNNVDIATSMEYQIAVNNMYSMFSLSPYQPHIKGGADS